MDSRVARATPLDTRAARMTEEEAFQPLRKNLSPLLSPSRSRNRESSVFIVSLHTRAIPWRHLRAPAGVAAPRSRILFGGEDCLSEASWSSYPRQLLAPCPGRLRAWLRRSPELYFGGEDCLSEASSAAQTFRDCGKGTRRATPGRPWFWVLLPKQKDLVVWGRNPTLFPPRRAGPKPRKHSLLSCISRL